MTGKIGNKWVTFDRFSAQFERELTAKFLLIARSQIVDGLAAGEWIHVK